MQHPPSIWETGDNLQQWDRSLVKPSKGGVSVNAAMLYNAIGNIDDDILVDAEQFIRQQKRQRGSDVRLV